MIFWQEWVLIGGTIVAAVVIYFLGLSLAVQITTVAVLAEMLGTGYVHLLLRTGHKDGFVDRLVTKLVSEAGKNRKAMWEGLEGLLVARLEVFVYATLWTVIFVSVFISCALTILLDQTLTGSQHNVVTGVLIGCALTAILLPVDNVREWFFGERPFDEKYIGKPASGLHFGAVYKSPMFWGRLVFSLAAIGLAYVLS